MDDIESWLPLSTAVLHILLALAGQERHGYAIMTEIARQSGGRYKVGPGTLYGNLDRLLEHGLVEEHDRRPADDDPRRRYYRLTKFGKRVLNAEADRLAQVVKEVRTHLAPATGRA
ncbi:MAG TPA: PadR family transcriptional regulator [Bryobacteraceae bacterium]|nr:PadR family transcriptional regulator [Bryobacteraceae bacterium]